MRFMYFGNQIIEIFVTSEPSINILSKLRVRIPLPLIHPLSGNVYECREPISDRHFRVADDFSFSVVWTERKPKHP